MLHRKFRPSEIIDVALDFYYEYNYVTLYDKEDDGTQWKLFISENMVTEYMKPSKQKHWLIVRHKPVEEEIEEFIKRMILEGYVPRLKLKFV